MARVRRDSELEAKNYGAFTASAIQAFQERYCLPPGDALDPSTGLLLHAAAAFACFEAAWLCAPPFAKPSPQQKPASPKSSISSPFDLRASRYLESNFEYATELAGGSRQ
jgi:hypothetical protein